MFFWFGDLGFFGFWGFFCVFFGLFLWGFFVVFVFFPSKYEASPTCPALLFVALPLWQNMKACQECKEILSKLLCSLYKSALVLFVVKYDVESHIQAMQRTRKELSPELTSGWYLRIKKSIRACSRDMIFPRQLRYHTCSVKPSVFRVPQLKILLWMWTNF